MTSEEDFHYFTSSIVSLVTGISFFKVIKNSFQIYQNKRLVKEIQKSPIKAPDDKFDIG